MNKERSKPPPLALLLPAAKAEEEEEKVIRAIKVLRKVFFMAFTTRFKPQSLDISVPRQPTQTTGI